MELKEAYGNAAAASFALDPAAQGPVSGFQEDRAGGPAVDMDPADHGPSSLALSVEPRQVSCVRTQSVLYPAFFTWVMPTFGCQPV